MKNKKGDASMATETTAETTELAIQYGSEWLTEFDQADIIIPRLRIIQKTSKAMDVLPDARPGQIRDTIEENIYADETTRVELMFLLLNKTITEQKKVKGDSRFAYMATLAFDQRTAALPWQDKLPNGDEIKRIVNYNFYVLRVSDDIDTEVPFLCTMSSTSTGTAKKLCTRFMKLNAKGLPMFAETVKLFTRKESSPENTWHVFDYEPGRPVTKQEAEAAKSWVKTLRARGSNVQVREESADRADVVETETVMEF